MTPENKKGLFYGWYIAGVAFMANFMTTGSHFYIFNAFMEPLCASRGWTRTEVNLALMMGSLAGMASQVLFGTLVMRMGPRALMLLGSLLSGTAFILMGRTEVLWRFYLFYILLYVGNMAYGGIVANTAVSNWFVLKRGRALGLATSGTSLSGAVLPFAAMLILEAAGLAGASAGIGAVILAVGPVAWLVIRNWPEDYGLTPDGLDAGSGRTDEIPPAGSESHKKNLNQWPLSRLIRTGTFWRLGGSYALILAGSVGVMSQLKPRFTGLGFSNLEAMGLMAATAACGAVGKYAWGVLCDRFDPRRVAAAIMGLNGLGLGLSFLYKIPGALFLFVPVYGFAMGGIMSSYPIIIAHLFGRESFAGVTRYVTLFLILQMAGFLIAGQSFDRFGSYGPAYMIFIALDLSAALLILTVRKPG